MRIKPTDALSAPEFLERNPPAYEHIRIAYRCRGCGHTASLPLPTGPVTCERCGTRMRPTT